MFRAASLLCLALALPAQADIPRDVAVAQILSGWHEADGSYMAGIRITLKPGWKTYWRAPGDAGIPPQFDWTGSRNLGRVEPHFPIPSVFWQNGMRSVGYEGDIVLPITVTPATPGEKVTLSGRMNIGVCLDVCIPVSIDLGQGASDGSAMLREAMARMPVSAAEAGVGRVTCAAEPIRDGMRITATIDMPAIGGDEIAVIEMPDPAIWVSEADVSRHGGQLTAVADLVPPTAKPFAVDRSGVRITVIAGDAAVDIKGCTGS